MAEITTGATAISDLDGLFKEVYAERLKDLVPKGLKLIRDVGFSQRDRHGKQYHQPVLLQRESGFTYAKSNTGAFALGGNVSGKTEDAVIDGSEFMLQGALAYEAASRSVGGGKRAFLAASELLVTNLWESALKRLEIHCFYGRTGLGIVDSISSDTITIKTAEWAPGIWGGNEGANVHVLTSDFATDRGNSTISSVDIDNRTVTLTSAPGGVVDGDILIFGTTLGSNAGSEIVAGGTPTHNVFLGLHEITKNTGSIFGIDASTYSLWKGNTVSAGSTDLSFKTIQKAVAKAVGKGQDSDMCCYVSAETWSNLMSDIAALRRLGKDDGSTKYEIGAESIQFWAQCGMIDIKPSIYVKEGYAYLVDPKKFMRIGSSDVTFRRPGSGENFFRDLSSNAGYELRAWSDQALFTWSPGTSVQIDNIVNSS